MITEASDTTYLPWQARILVTKSVAMVTTAGGINPTYSDSGDIATFDITIKNTGNTRLTKVQLTDGMFGENIICDHDFSAGASIFLPASDSDGHPIVCEATMVLTTADIDTGSISGTAKVRGLKQNVFKRSSRFQEWGTRCEVFVKGCQVILHEHSQSCRTPEQLIKPLG